MCMPIPDELPRHHFWTSRSNITIWLLITTGANFCYYSDFRKMKAQDLERNFTKSFTNTIHEMIEARKRR